MYWGVRRGCRAASALASERTSTSTTPAACCSRAGPMSFASTAPRPAPLTIAGPAMPMLAVVVAMMTSQMPSSAALPSKWVAVGAVQ